MTSRSLMSTWHEKMNLLDKESDAVVNAKAATSFLTLTSSHHIAVQKCSLLHFVKGSPKFNMIFRPCAIL